MESRRYNTPCIGQCSTVFGDTVCRGCLRFVHEIIDWNRYDDDEKTVVWQRLEMWVTTVLPSFIRVDDPRMIEQAVLMHRLPYRSGNLWHNVYNLLRLAERRHFPLDGCGFRLEDGFTTADVLASLHQLADAYYERDFLRARRMAGRNGRG